MVQQVTTKFQEFDTSTVQNRRFVDVVSAGVYLGYEVTPSSGTNGFLLDIISGLDGRSTLVSPEGVVVTETADILGAVLLDPADPNFSRVDVVVAEYRYSTANLPQTYRVVKGLNQVSDGTPVVPEVDNLYQVPLAYVRVRSGATSIEISDITPVVKQTSTVAKDRADLRASRATGDARVLYVAPGTFYDVTGTKLITFEGGYSTPITDPTFANGTTRYYLFALTDDKKIVTPAFADTLDELMQTATTTFAVAQVKATKSAGRVLLSDIRDVRVPFARGVTEVEKIQKYRDLLATSIFKNLFVQPFDTGSGIVEGTVAGGAVELDSSGKALHIAGIAGTDVTFVTEDLVGESSISVIEEFLLAHDSTVENLSFDYSTVSPLTGFTGNKYKPGEIVSIPGRLAAKLYIKFTIPQDEFVRQNSTRIFSYGVLFNVDNSRPSSFSITELGIRDLASNMQNLIANGNFYYWSQSTVSGKSPNLLTTSTLSFPVSDELPLAADGWQFTSIKHNFDSGSVSRVPLNTDSTSTALRLQLTTSSAAQTSDATVLEYRLPRAQDLAGKRLTLALDYRVTTRNVAALGVAEFRRTVSGLVQLRKTEVSLSEFAGTARLVTPSAIGSDTDVVSFYIRFSADTPITATLWSVRAAVGEFGVLPFVYSGDAATQLRSYVERGQAYLAGEGSSGSPVGTSIQFAGPKHLELGDIIAETDRSPTANISNGIGSLSYQPSRESLIVSTASSSSGPFTLQVDWVSFVKYTGTVV